MASHSSKDKKREKGIVLSEHEHMANKLSLRL
jgi:hypothetical protein